MVFSDQKVFLTIQLAIVSVMLLLFLILNVSIDLPDRPDPVIEDVPAVCGDGIVSEGETRETCCQDVGCAAGYDCTGNICILAGKYETQAFEEFVLAGKNVLLRTEAFVPREDLTTVQNLFSDQLQVLGASGFQIEPEQEAYDVLTRHSEVLYSLINANRRIQPITSSDVYLGVVLNGGFATPDDRQRLEVAGDLAVDALSDAQRFMSYLNNLDNETRSYLELHFDFVVDDVVEDYLIRQVFFDEVAVNLDARGIILYNSILQVAE